MRDRRCHATVDTIEKALAGNYRAEHLFAIEQALALYDTNQQKASACDARIEAVLKELSAPRGRKAGPLPSPRQNRSRQQNSLLFGTAGLRSPRRIARMIRRPVAPVISVTTARQSQEVKCFAPSNEISGGKMLSSRTRRSGSRAAALLRLAAVTVGRTDTALGAFYRRLSARIGKAKAVTATARKIAVLFYNGVRHGMNYVDPGASSYEIRYRARVIDNLHRRAKAFGFMLQPMAPTSGMVVS
jgi:transposase